MRNSIKPLNQKLFEEPYSFEFFQAVRLLEKIYPERRPVGREALPHNEIIKFRTRMTLDFPASQIHEINETIEESTDRKILEMYINFMGMGGPIGVLPIHYTELMVDRARYRDTAMWEFLDIYTHRAVSLFFRAWEKYRFPVQYERGNDGFTEYLFDFAGLGTKGLRGKMDLDEENLLPYVGLIAQKPHSAVALQQIVSDYFGVETGIIQFFGQWIDLEAENITVVGKANSELGYTTIVGTRVWEQQSKFRFRLGPLAFKQFQGFLPNGTAYKPLNSIARFMVGLEFDYDVQLILKAKEVPSCILTTRARRRPMLGWSSWLKTKPFEQDDEQVILQMN